ncbi:hypothetical protein BSKO_10736 [Bryopsis sp. KO-2023]|nr:hypothetical protein BSKO_10736 [Bryopsis sp. KO-2023]
MRAVAITSVVAGAVVGLAAWWRYRRGKNAEPSSPQLDAITGALVPYKGKPEKAPPQAQAEEVVVEEFEAAFVARELRLLLVDATLDLVLWAHGNSVRAVGTLTGAATVVFVEGREILISRGGLMGGIVPRNLATGIFVLPDAMFQDEETLRVLLLGIQDLAGNGLEPVLIAAHVHEYLRGCGVVPPPGFSPPWIFRHLGDIL